MEVYMYIWTALCIVAVIVALQQRRNIELFQKEYWIFLTQPWKVILFIMATTCWTIAAPYSSDPTWDYTDAVFISLFTYATAPWCIGAVYKHYKSFSTMYLALCITMFSVCWSYELYVLIRYGYYPETWLINIPLSIPIYVLAGMTWNLCWDHEVTFAYKREKWFDNKNDFVKIFPALSAFSLIVTSVIIAFVAQGV
jgi:hypothetical protein